MDPVAAGKLQNPVMRPLVVVSTSPFQITSVESTNPRFRCDLPLAAASHIPPIAGRFPWRRHAGQGRHANSHPDNRFGGADRGRSEHQLDSARRCGKDGRQEAGRKQAGEQRRKPEEKGGRSGVSGPPARLQATIFHATGVLAMIRHALCSRRIDTGRFRGRCWLPRGPTNRRRRPRISSTARRWKAGR